MFHWITFDAEILGGKPHVRGTRLSVEFIMELFASGAAKTEIIQTYPQLTPEAIDEVLHYAARSVKNEVFLSAEVAV